MARKKSDPTSESLRSPEVAETGSASRVRALVFISHDTRDGDIAEAFSNLLQDASGGILRSFRSSDRKGTSGIEFGAEWYSTIMGKLKDATDVVALLTPHSIGRPWILYEAGVAKGRLDATVFGVAIGIPLSQASVGPFAQFQNSEDDEDSLTKLVLQLIRRNPDAQPREEAVRRQVAAFRATTAELMKSRAVPPVGARKGELDNSAVAKLFEEVKVMFRQLPEQLERTIELRLHQSRLGTPELIHEGTVQRMFERLSEAQLGERPSPWIGIVHLTRSWFPSLHRASLQMDRAWRRGDPTEVARAAALMQNALRRAEAETDLAGSLTGNAESARELRELPRMLDYILPMIAARVQGNSEADTKPAAQPETGAAKTTARPKV